MSPRHGCDVRGTSHLINFAVGPSLSPRGRGFF